MRYRILTAAGVAMLALMVSMTPAAASPKADDKPAQRKVSGRAVDLKNIKEKPAQPALLTKAETAKTNADCAQVTKDPQAFAKGGAKLVSCTTMKSERKSGASTQAVASCSDDPAYIWFYHRFGACTWGYIEEVIIDVQTRLPVGGAQWKVTQELTLQSTSGLFFENVWLEFEWAWGPSNQPAGRRIAMGGVCYGACNPLQNVAFNGTIGLGQTRSGQIVHEGVTTGARTFTETAYQMLVVPPPGVTGEMLVDWTGPGRIRCDRELAQVGGGCVMPDDVPTFYPSVSQFGPATINIAVAQNLPDHWGWLTPLNRLTDGTVRDRNQQLICAGFVPDPWVERDSCDEFAFASSFQSGPMLTPPTTDCAEIIPFNQGGAWYYEVVKMTGNERCLRGHVDLTMNSLLGAFLGSTFLTPNRVLLGDPYYVTPVW